MTKRILSLLLALLLLFSTAAAQSPYELSKVHLYGSDFAISYPSSWDVSTDNSENTDDYLYCGMLYSPADDGLNVEIYRSFLDDWADQTLLDMDHSGLTDFQAMLQELYAEDMHYEPLSIIYTTASGIPFLIFSGYDEYGPLFIAESMLDGWFITIYGYAYTDATYTTCRPLTDDDLALFTEIVKTYEPMNLTIR